MSFSFSKSSRFLVLFSVVAQDGPYPRAVDEDACTPLIDEAWTPVDMTFSVMRSMRISLTDFSTSLKSLDMHAQNQVSQVSDQVLNVTEWVVRPQIGTVQKKLVLYGLK
jgi:hypothetical protein